MSGVNSEILAIIDTISTEKSISKNIIVDAIENAFATIAKTFYGNGCDVVVKMNTKSGEMAFFQKKIVRPTAVTEYEISLPDARVLNPDAEENGFVLVAIPALPLQIFPSNQIRKEIIERIRAAEKEHEYNEYKKREGEIVVGVVKTTGFNTIVGLGNKVEGIIFKEGLLKTDNYKPGDKIKAYIKEVKRSDYNCQVILSRTDNNFLAMLIAEQVIEIQDGMIDVKAISRRPGEKAKVAVCSNDGRLDAVGACIGARGSRIKPIVDELRGEKVDIVNWDRDVVNFAKNAITPAKAVFGEYDEDNETISLVVPDDQLKLAIGKAGLNVRLASQVVGCDITVISESDKKAKAQEKFAKDVDLMVKALDVEEPVAQFFVSSSIYTPADLVSVGAEKLVKSGVFNDDIANELINRASEYLAKQKAQNEAKLEKLGVDKSVLEIKGMTPEIAILLGDKGVKTTQDVADLSSDELVDICGEQYANVATKIVMSARQIAYGIE